MGLRLTRHHSKDMHKVFIGAAGAVALSLGILGIALARTPSLGPLAKQAVSVPAQGVLIVALGEDAVRISPDGVLLRVDATNRTTLMRVAAAFIRAGVAIRQLGSTVIEAVIRPPQYAFVRPALQELLRDGGQESLSLIDQQPWCDLGSRAIVRATAAAYVSASEFTSGVEPDPSKATITSVSDSSTQGLHFEGCYHATLSQPGGTYVLPDSAEFDESAYASVTEQVDRLSLKRNLHAPWAQRRVEAPLTRVPPIETEVSMSGPAVRSQAQFGGMAPDVAMYLFLPTSSSEDQISAINSALSKVLGSPQSSFVTTAGTLWALPLSNKHVHMLIPTLKTLPIEVYEINVSDDCADYDADAIRWAYIMMHRQAELISNALRLPMPDLAYVGERFSSNSALCVRRNLPPRDIERKIRLMGADIWSFADPLGSDIGQFEVLEDLEGLWRLRGASAKYAGGGFTVSGVAMLNPHPSFDNCRSAAENAMSTAAKDLAERLEDALPSEIDVEVSEYQGPGCVLDGSAGYASSVTASMKVIP